MEHLVESKNHQLIYFDRDIAAQSILLDDFSKSKFDIKAFGRPNEAIYEALSAEPDLVIVSLAQDADIEEQDMIVKIREVKHTPIIVLTNDVSELNRISAYRQGVDDYIQIPASHTEIIARVENVLSRYKAARAVILEKGAQSDLRVGDLCVPEKGSVTWEGNSISLTQTEKALLNILVKYFGKPLSKQYLQMLILKRPFCRYDRSIDMHISNLRKKLSWVGHPPEKIYAVRGYGYCYR